MKRKTPLNRQSSKAGTFKDELDAMREVVLVRAGYRCEMAGCGNEVDVVHHRKRRSQGGTNDLDNLMGLCNGCHVHVHEMPTWSYEWGYLLRRNDLVTPLTYSRVLNQED